MASVILQNIGKHFGKTTILDNLSLRAESNQLTVFVGPSGCGKSTILRLIAGLENPDAGDIYIDAQRVTRMPPFTRGVAMVFQSYALYPHMSVEENMKFGLSALKLPKPEVQKRIAEAAELLELTPYLERKPKQLSGGQRQRVAMARALVRQPKVFLFDEPLSNLDASLRVKMRLEIARFREMLNATAVYVTHDQVEAMTLANKIVVLRAGRIEQEGPPLEVYHHPANKFVASFLGSPSMNFIPATLEGRQLSLPDGSRVGVDHVPGAGKEHEFGIRPEHLTLDEQMPCKLEGKVFAVEQLGDQVLAYLKLDCRGPDTSLVARLPGNAGVSNGSKLKLGFDPKHAHLFNETGSSVGAAFGAVQ